MISKCREKEVRVTFPVRWYQIQRPGGKNSRRKKGDWGGKKKVELKIYGNIMLCVRKCLLQSMFRSGGDGTMQNKTEGERKI